MIEPRARVQALAVLCLGSAFVIAACEQELRLSAEGESCGRTDDCAPPLRCVAQVCIPPDGAGGAPATSSSDATTTTVTVSASKSSSESSADSSSSGLDPTLCATCLDQKCGTQLGACGGDCLGVEACIEAACKNLVQSGLPDEGPCQVYCQNQFPAGKQPHLAVADCSQTAGNTCGACSSNPFDYSDCRSKANLGPCEAARTACQNDLDCTQYTNCSLTCTTLATCVACQNGMSGAAGFALAMEYERCIAAECIAESWLP